MTFSAAWAAGAPPSGKPGTKSSPWTWTPSSSQRSLPTYLHLQPKDLAGPWDVILASPPCNAFSVASIAHYWHDGTLPKKPGAYQGIALLAHALYLILSLKPTYWILENPRGMMRNLPFLQRFERREVTYCQYGDTAQKPTDLWGVFPPGFEAKKCYPSAPCHAPAPRGTHGAGTVQGKTGAAARAEVPLGLSKAVLEAIP